MLRRKHLERLVIAIVGGISVGVVASTLLDVHRCYTEVPSWDQWEVLERAESVLEGNVSAWSAAWMPHAGHRMLFPYLLHFASVEWFSYRAFPLIALSLALHAAIAALLMWLAWRSSEGSLARACVALTIPILLFGSWGLENFIWPMQVSYLLAYSFAIAGMYLVARDGAGPRPCFAAGLALGVLASFSMLQGLGFWPCAALVLLLRRDFRTAAIVALVGTGVAIGCLVGNPWIADALQPSEGVTALLRRLILFPAFLGGGLAMIDGRLAILAGGMLVVAASVFTWRSVVEGPVESDRAFLLGTVAFAFLSSILILFGRFSADHLPHSWTELDGFRVVSRYMMVSLYAWSAVVIYLFRFSQRRRFAYAVISLIAVGSLGTLCHQRAHSAWWVVYYSRVAEAGQRLKAGSDDADSINVISPDPDKVLRLQPFLKRHRLAFFADSDE